MTATTGNVHTAAEFNTYWRDNLLASEAAVASTTGALIVASAAHVLAQRIPTVAFTPGYESTATATYTTLSESTLVAVATGQWAMLMVGGAVSNDTAGLGSRISVDIAGATTVAAVDANSFYAESGTAGDGYQGTWTTVYYPLTDGWNFFDLRYRTTAGGGTSTFGHRLCAVVPF